MRKISILLPTYNRKKRIQNQIEFMNNENVFSNPELEIVVSNNASTDGTKEYLSRLKKNNLIIYNQNENIGIIANFRFLIEHCKGEYIWIIGDDDTLYPGIFKKVLDYIYEYPNVGHIFLNYAGIKNNQIIMESVLGQTNRFYNDGLEMMRYIVDYCEFGCLLFISANIYRRDVVIETNNIIDENDETENLALPLGYSIFATKYENLYIGEVLLANDSTQVSWNSQRYLLYCRDMIKMYDLVTSIFVNYEELRDYFVHHIPVNFPEFRYLLFGKKFKKDNFAMTFYKKYYPYKIFMDIVKLPYYCIESFLRNIKK